MRASRRSHSTASNGCVPGLVKKRLISSAVPGAVACEMVGWGASFIGPSSSAAPRCGRLFELLIGGQASWRSDRTEPAHETRLETAPELPLFYYPQGPDPSRNAPQTQAF